METLGAVARKRCMFRGGPQQGQSKQNPSSSTTKALELGQLPEVDSKVRDVAFQQSWSIRSKLDLAAVIDTTDSLNNRQEYQIGRAHV
jgi:hypothetical protein